METHTMTLLEQVALLRELVAAVNDLRQTAFDTPRKPDALKHLEWAIDDLAKRIWLRGTKEGN